MASSSRIARRHHRREAARRRDQPLAALAQQIEVDARLVVEALEVALRDQLASGSGSRSSFIASSSRWLIASKPASSCSRPFLLEARARGDVDLAAEDRLHAGVARLLVELDGAEEVAVVGHRDRRHAERLGAREERLVLDRAVEERVLGVEVQVGERVAASPGLLPLDRGGRLRRDVVDDAVDALHLVGDAARRAGRARRAEVAPSPPSSRRREVTQRSATTWS